MIIRTRFIVKGINAALVALTFLLTGIYSCTVQAQSIRPFKYMGFEASFGVRSFEIKSSIPQLNSMPVVQEGGSLGVLFGNDFLRAKVRVAGFYYSSASVPRTVDLFESEGFVNFYPLNYIRSGENALDVYLIAGISMDNIKFYGHYLTAEGEKVNYSTSSEPYLGKISQLNATGGLGLEYKLPTQAGFIHLFGEAKYGSPFQSGTDSESFKNTSIRNFTSISVGVSFGVTR